jgi:hypothetical protein
MGRRGTSHQAEPSRDDSPDRLPRFRIVGKRRVFHALLDFKPPNRNFRRIRNRFIDIGCHALLPYYRLWQRWQDKANIRRTIRCNRTICCTEVSAYEILDERRGSYLRNQIAELIHRQLFGNHLRSQFSNCLDWDFRSSFQAEGTHSYTG